MTLISDIQDAIPGVQSYRAQLDAIKAESARRLRAGAATGPTYYESAAERVLREMLDAGEHLDALDRRIGEQITADAASDAAFAALRNRQTTLEANLAGLLTDAARVFPRLDAALQETVEDITALQPISEILTAEDVLASRRLDDGERLATLLGDVTALRAEQMRVHTANGDVWPKVAILRLVSNPADLFDDLLPWLRPGFLVNRTSGEERQILPPPAWGWPRIQQHATSTDQTLWFLKHGGRMWIPSPAQYEDAAKALRVKAASRSAATREGDWIDPGPAQDSPARPLRGRRSTAHVTS